jgi:uncharacterized protein YukE
VTFSVNPERLELFAAQVQRAETHAEGAQEYLLSEGHLDAYSQGMLGLLNSSNRAVFDLVSAELTQLSTLCGSAGRALRHAAGYYRTTDNAAAENADEAYQPQYDRATYTAALGGQGEGN